ncbi:hypothetical protein L1987_75869 [Smallanthus sonchifolius]|uniref:Uncharacterized protein n=1 Tax=Smallanthus sonchifolius TaxID=185202 RepID=A0ACB9A7P1_9ASTR|nr:hypothetical protein L1987_75869 [Smallanthus sonchifolius]
MNHQIELIGRDERRTTKLSDEVTLFSLNLPITKPELRNNGYHRHRRRHDETQPPVGVSAVPSPRPHKPHALTRNHTSLQRLFNLHPPYSFQRPQSLRPPSLQLPPHSGRRRREPPGLRHRQLDPFNALPQRQLSGSDSGLFGAVVVGGCRSCVLSHRCLVVRRPKGLRWTQSSEDGLLD